MRETQFQIIPAGGSIHLGIITKYFIIEKETGDYFGFFEDKYSGINAILELYKYYKMPKYHHLELYSQIYQTRLPLLKSFTREQVLLPSSTTNTEKVITSFKIVKSTQSGYFAIIKEGTSEVMGVFTDRNTGLNIVHGLKNYEMPKYHEISLCVKILRLEIPFLARTQSVYSERKRDFH